MAGHYAAPVLVVLVAILAVLFVPIERHDDGPSELDHLDERPYAVIAAEAATAEGDAAGGPPLLTPVAEGIFELVAPSPGRQHQKCVQLFRSGSNRSLKAKARVLDLRWQAGNLSAPCVWSQRMAVVALGKGVLLYNPVECTEERVEAVRALGGASVLVLPNFEHATGFEFEGWLKAFPDALVVTVSGSKMVKVLKKIPKSKMLLLSSSLPTPPKVQKLLKEFDIEVANMGSLEDEILLHHRLSKSLLVADFILFGSTDKEDPDAWPRLGSPKWTHLYYWFHARFTPHLLPVYRMGFTTKQKRTLMSSLERILELKAERVLSAHAGRVSEEGAAQTAELLRKSWRWCNASKPR